MQIPAAFGKPITLKDLMTHTPGFEDRPVGLLCPCAAAEMKPLAEVLKSDMPACVRAAGSRRALTRIMKFPAGRAGGGHGRRKEHGKTLSRSGCSFPWA